MNIFFLGLAGNIFSRGLYDMARDNSGLVFTHNQWKKVAKTLVRDFKQSKITHVNLCGHSLGARSCLKVAKYLVKNEVPVNKLILLDYVEGNRFWYPQLLIPKSIDYDNVIHLRTLDRRVKPLMFWDKSTSARTVIYDIPHADLDDYSSSHQTVKEYLGD